MLETSIAVENLSYQYGRFKAVDDISFTVASGEILGFLGPNGSGKTTTLKMLTGQLIPQQGRVLILGHDVTKATALVRSRIGVSFEQTNLYEQMSALENLALFADLFNVKNFDGYGLLKRVGLTGREKDKVSGYSKGMKQRLMIARSIVNSPSVIFMDEPTAGLDPVSSETIGNIILEEQARGATIFLTTHDMWEADKLCQRVAFINQGKLVALDSPHNLKQRFGKRKLVAEIAKPAGGLEKREIEMDSAATASSMEALFSQEKIITLHSAEATLEEIFIQITGQRLRQ
ncbi:MAG TPA: ABC transporter ATP-binding protein [Dehalococcoidales bacterium]|nr:ABC transporter ATP-binding protein [Dehalococcoidales bacterium]